MSRYLLGHLAAEIERLELQAALFEPLTLQALVGAGIKEGMRCIDIGCGSGSVTRMMAEIVGMKGQVVGLDIDEKYLQYCRSRVRGDTNVEYVCDDISRSNKLLQMERFDIVFSRFVFVHLRNRMSAVQTMKQILKTHGKIVIQELDHAPGSWLSYPENKNVEKLRKVYVALVKKFGGDHLAGRKLYKLLVDGSLDAQVMCFSPCLRMGHEPYSTLGWRIAESLKPQILAQKLLSSREFAKLYEGLRQFSEDKRAFVTYARFFSVTGSQDGAQNVNSPGPGTSVVF